MAILAMAEIPGATHEMHDTVNELSKTRVSA